MKPIWRRSCFLICLSIALTLTGCLGGGGHTTTYFLRLTILNDLSGMPIPGATIQLVGKSLTIKSSDANGKVAFSGLSGTVEITVEHTGFKRHNETFKLTEDKTAVVRLQLSDSAAVVSDAGSLLAAIADEKVDAIFVQEDIATDEVVIPRPLNIDLGRNTFTGDLGFDFTDPGEFRIDGSGKITGDLRINTPVATISNTLEVGGMICVQALGNETWHEYCGLNRFAVDAQNSRILFYEGAKSIRFTDQARDNELNIKSGTVRKLVADSSVTVTGADKILWAEINAEGVVFDYTPRQITGSAQPTILYPNDPTQPKEFANPRFVTLTGDNRCYNFDREEHVSDGEEADIRLWSIHTEDYICYLEDFKGTWFRDDRNIGADHLADDTYYHFRTVNETDWEIRDPIEYGSVRVYDTILLKTRAGRFVKLFVIDVRGHFNHADRPAVDFVYMFLDEEDNEPPVLESITLRVDEEEVLTKEISDVIEFTIPTTASTFEIVLNLNETVYCNRGLVQKGTFPGRNYPLFVSAYPEYYNRPTLSTQMISFPMQFYEYQPDQQIVLPGDDDFWQNHAEETSFEDLGYVFCDVMGNKLTELPFEKIILQREQ